MYLKAARGYGSIIPGGEAIRSMVRRGEVSKEAEKRLRWMDYYARCGNARKTCRYYGISAQTFYRWKRRYDPGALRTLEEVSRRPHRVRKRERPAGIEGKILELRGRYPRWGRTKLAVLLEREGIRASGSTVGRVMAELKKRGLLVEPENVRQAKLARNRRRKPRYAVRKPRGYKVDGPGDLVQVDTLQVKIVPDEVRFQFSAWDMAAKYCAFRAYKRQTSTAGTDFLHHLRTKFPFRIKAIQIDGGSEFKDQFEAACRKHGIRLFVNPPRCPEMNGGVERSNRTSREEFYEVEDLALAVDELNQQLAAWEHTYNCIRPHQRLDYLTPYEYYRLWKKTQKTQVSPMY
jgi:putative transposase